MATQSLQPAVSSESAYRKVAWRVIPLLFVCYICAYLDRVNLAFAKLQMQSDVPGISDSVYGVGRNQICNLVE
jgi:sugar phosphate permease